jgi:hypothetical protein
MSDREIDGEGCRASRRARRVRRSASTIVTLLPLALLLQQGAILGPMSRDEATESGRANPSVTALAFEVECTGSCTL